MLNIVNKWMAAVGAGSILILTACSGGTEAVADVATLESSDSELGSAADAAVVDEGETGDGAPDEVALEFSQCMRDEGLDFPDLSIDAEGNIELRDALGTVDPATEGFRDALDACGDILQQTGFGGQGRVARDSPEFQDALLDFSACLRDEGFDVGDLTLGAPAPGGGQPPADGQADGGGDGAGQRGERAEGFGDRGARFAESLGLDYQDPAVEEAVTACMVVIDEALADVGVGEAEGGG